MSETSPSPYSIPEPFLEQGDIFCQELVTPVCSTDKRIFRAADGRHGVFVFQEGVEAEVFTHEGLNEHLSKIERNAHHSEPFTGYNGHPELVVTHAELRNYYIIATQTCDVSGVDGDALPTALVLPILTLRQAVRNNPLPIGNGGASITIEQFLVDRAGAETLPTIAGDMEYGIALRKALDEWAPADKYLLQLRNRISNFLGKKTPAWMYYLPPDGEMKVPESFVDYSAAFTVYTERLFSEKDRRIGSLRSPYKEDFARKFGNLFSRVALPTQFAPPGAKPLAST